MKQQRNPVSLNSRAVILLQEYQFNRATKLLRKGLECCRTVSSLWDEPSNNEKGKNETVLSVLKPKPVTIHMTWKCTRQRLPRPTSMFSFFNRAFLIAADESALKMMHMHERRVALVLLFNSGLAFHNQAVQTKNDVAKIRTCFEAALAFYEEAVGVLVQECDSFILKETTDCAEFRLLIMALFNNMGHIFANTCDFENAKICCDWIRQILAVGEPIRGDCNGDSICEGTQDEQCVDGNDNDREGYAESNSKVDRNYSFFYQNSHFQFTRRRMLNPSSA
jgi:hypothetical protein